LATCTVSDGSPLLRNLDKHVFDLSFRKKKAHIARGCHESALIWRLGLI